MFTPARLKELFGDSRSTYASKAMHWIGDTLIISRKEFGMPGDFWDDQEDRAVLKGGEVGDPQYQRLQVRTDDFRRYLTYGVGRAMPYAIPVLAVPLLIAGILLAKAFGPDLGGAGGAGLGVEELSESQVSHMSLDEVEDNEIAQAIREMSADGKTEQTLNREERAIVAEARRRGLMK